MLNLSMLDTVRAPASACPIAYLALDLCESVMLCWRQVTRRALVSALSYCVLAVSSSSSLLAKSHISHSSATP
eukprot:2020706-Pleurochrysis_carterae.AAC.1